VQPKKTSPEVVGSNPTEPANYRGSYITEAKEIADIEIAMCGNAGIEIIDIENFKKALYYYLPVPTPAAII
jgi:hypothetical protein